MQVTITRLAEEIDVESGAVRNYGTLRLPDGCFVRVEIQEADVATIVGNLREGARGDARPSEAPGARLPHLPREVTERPAGRAPHVVKDDMGYPVLTSAQGASMGAPSLADEDGIGQL